MEYLSRSDLSYKLKFGAQIFDEAIAIAKDKKLELRFVESNVIKDTIFALFRLINIDDGRIESAYVSSASTGGLECLNEQDSCEIFKNRCYLGVSRLRKVH